MPPVNLIAILLCGVAAVVIGAAWYGPLFGRAWMKTLGLDMDTLTPEQKAKGMKTMPRNIILSFLAALVIAYVLTQALAFGDAYLHMTGIAANLMGAFWYWLGFTVPAILSIVLWEDRPVSYWFINIGYWLVLTLVMSAIITALG